MALQLEEPVEGIPVGSLVVGGVLSGAGSIEAGGVAYWDGFEWRSLASGPLASDLGVFALTTFDFDGDGPGLPRLVAGGDFRDLANGTLEYAAVWDGASWQPLGQGLNGRVEALTVIDVDGAGPEPERLVAGGSFSFPNPQGAGSVSVGIAWWDGAAWQQFDPNRSLRRTYALAVFDFDGDGPEQARLVAVDDAADQAVYWDGGAWVDIGEPFNNRVELIDTYDLGSGPELVMSGFITQSGTTPVSYLVRWNGSGWESLGGGTDSEVTGIAVARAGGAPQLYAVGRFTTAGGVLADKVAQWDGAAWSAVRTGLSDPFEPSGVFLRTVVTFDSDGGGPEPESALVFGSFDSVDGTAVSNVAEWDGTTWGRFGLTPGKVPGFAGSIEAAIPYNPTGQVGGVNELIIGGDFFSDAGENIVRLGENDWEPLGSTGLGANGPVLAFELFDHDDDPATPDRLIAGGFFSSIDGVAANSIAQWDGASWTPLGSGILGSVGSFPGDVNALQVFDRDGPGGQRPLLIAGGNFFRAGGSQAFHIAQWDGTSWSQLDQGLMDSVNALGISDPDGPGGNPPTLLVGGNFIVPVGVPIQNSFNYVAAWDGSGWSRFGIGLNGEVDSVQEFDVDGAGPTPAVIAVSGFFNQAFQPDGVPVNNVPQLAFWDGTAWSSPPGTAFLDDEAELSLYDADGPLGPELARLIVTNHFSDHGGVPNTETIAAWNGSGWEALGTGISGGKVNAMTLWDRDGESGPAVPALVVAGDFTRSGDVSSSGFAFWGRETSVWTQPLGGAITDAANWACGTEPGPIDRLVVDGARGGYPFTSFTISLPGVMEAAKYRSMTVDTDIVTLNLRAQSLELSSPASLTSPGLSIGGKNDQSVTFSVRNTLASDAELRASSLVLGSGETSGGVPGLLRSMRIQGQWAGVRVSGPAVVGQRGDSTELEVRGDGTLALEGDLEIGSLAGSSAEVRLEDTSSGLVQAGIGSSVRIGASGQGRLLIGGPAPSDSASATTGMIFTRNQEVIVGAQRGSIGEVVVDGSSSWAVSTQDFVIGQQGAGSLEIAGGSLLQSDSLGKVVIGEFAGAAGLVELRGQSSWIETGQTITVGQAGVLEVEAGSTVESLGLVLRPGGVMRGEGTIGNSSGIETDVVNFGDVAPRGAGDAAAMFAVEGSYRQIGQSAGGAPTSGRLSIRIDGAGNSDTLSVTGPTTFGGELVLIPSGEFIASGSLADASIVVADAGITGAFDAVLVSPALTGGRFLTVDYNTARDGARTAGTVSLGVASLSGDAELDPPNGFTTPGAPTDAVTADLNGDSFDDVVLVIPRASGTPGNLTILISDGMGDFSNQVTVMTAIDPRGVAVGDIDQLGGLDIAVTGFGDDTVRLYSTDGLALPTITPEATLTVADLPLLAEPFDVVVGQLNGGGPDDVALTSSGSDIVYLLETMPNPMTDPFEFEPCDVPAGTRPKELAWDILDADFIADFFVGNGQPGSFGVSAITSNGGFTVTTYPVGDEPGEVLLRDLNGDGAPDAAAVRPDGDVLSVLRNTGGGAFTPPADLPVGDAPRSLADADLDIDGDVDLAVVVDASGSRVVQILRNDTQAAGQLVFAASDQVAAGAAATLVRAGDLNDDGREDLLTLDGGAGVPRVPGGRATQDGNAVLLNPAPPSPCLADLTTDGTANGVPDGAVTLSDFSFYLSLWGSSDASADLTTDGTSDGVPDGQVTLSDFSFYLSLWGVGCP